MKKQSKLYRWAIAVAVLIGLIYAGNVQAQAPQGYYGPTANTGTASHGVGTGTNAFNMATGSTYDAFAYGAGSDYFLGPNFVAGAQEIAGSVAPNFDTLYFNNGSASPLNITDTGGIIVNARLAYNNGITTTLRSTRAAGLAGAIKFLVNASYTPVLAPATGTDVTFTDGFVSKVNPSAFVFPVGNVTDLRTITATGTGTYATAWSNANVSTAYTGALPAGIAALGTNGYWEWSGSAAATATLSIPDETAFAPATNLSLVGYNGTAWVSLGGAFTANTENSTNTVAVSVPANIVAIVLASTPITIYVNAKVFLQGPTTSGVALMDTSLNNLSLLPTHQPYNIAPFGAAATGYTGTDSVAPNFFASHLNIVDWVLVELRDVNNSATIIATRAALLRNDGVLVDTSGLPTIGFNGTPGGNYLLAIRHRNHLGVRSGSVAISTSSTLYDFTSGSVQANGSNAMVSVGGVYCLWAGNVNSDGKIANSASPSDVTQVTSSVANFSGNVLHSATYGSYKAYNINDVNLDGFIKNAASPSDVTRIVSDVSNYPANSLHSATYGNFVERLP